MRQPLSSGGAPCHARTSMSLTLVGGQQDAGLRVGDAGGQANAAERRVKRLQAFSAHLGHDVPSAHWWCKVRPLQARRAARMTSGLRCPPRRCSSRRGCAAALTRAQAHGVAGNHTAVFELAQAVLHRATGYAQLLRQHGHGRARIGTQDAQDLPSVSSILNIWSYLQYKTPIYSTI